MQCPNCGNVLSQGEQFCGMCGFQLGNNPSLLSQRQVPGFYSAPTVAGGFDVQAAMVALENPYHALLPDAYDLTKPSWSPDLNDDHKRVWLESRQSNGRAWYEGKGVFHLKGEQIETKAQHMSPIHDFTLQALVEFHPEQTDVNMLSILLISNDVRYWGQVADVIFWGIRLMAKSEKHDNTLRMGYGAQSLSLGVPSYTPFLLGIVRQPEELNVFVNLEHIASIPSIKNLSNILEGILKLSVYKGNATVSHTRLWVS